MRRDTSLIYAAALVRSTTVSLVGVTLAIHLASVGFSTTQIGLLIGVGLAGSSLGTAIVGLRGDAWGRRRVLIVLALLNAGGYLALGAFSGAAILIPLAFAGMLNGMGRDRGPHSALDQAILPATVPDERRTWTLAWYNLVVDAGHALGALAATVPSILTRVMEVSPDVAHRITFTVCAAAMIGCIVPYAALTPEIEVRLNTRAGLPRERIDARSRRVITRLALLF